MRVRGSVKPKTFLDEINPVDDGASRVLWFRENIEKDSRTDESGEMIEEYVYDEYTIIAPKNYSDIADVDTWKQAAIDGDPEPVVTPEDRTAMNQEAISENVDAIAELGITEETNNEDLMAAIAELGALIAGDTKEV